MPEIITAAAGDRDYEAFAALTLEYMAWIRALYADDAPFIEQIFQHQDLNRKLRTLRETFGPPQGRTVVAHCDDGVCGGGAYRRLPDGSCELKRLFVPDRFRGRGIGRRLGVALIESARADGYTRMRLDTGHRFVAAIALYRKLEFRDCAPHHAYPANLLPHLRFMAVPLGALEP
jgi:GNAT superfamily N-acetyltransferase